MRYDFMENSLRSPITGYPVAMYCHEARGHRGEASDTQR